jgi:hypothetical protein
MEIPVALWAPSISITQQEEALINAPHRIRNGKLGGQFWVSGGGQFWIDIYNLTSA